MHGGERERRRRLVAAGALAVMVLLVVVIVASPSGQPPVRRGAVADRGSSAPPPPRHRRRAPVPVLMYHGVEAPPPGSLAGLFVKPSAFAAQMRALARRGAHGVTMAQVEAAWSRGAPLPRKPIVITFDDGYRGQYENALPVLKRVRWPGVLYLCVANLGTNAGLSEQQVRGLMKSDWELGAHTFSHPDLRGSNPYELRHEVGGSRRWLERRFEAKVRDFAYPSGAYDDRTVKAVRDAGYQGAVTVAPGLASRSHPLTMDRVRVSSDTTASGLLEELAGLGWR